MNSRVVDKLNYLNEIDRAFSSIKAVTECILSKRRKYTHL